jgi:Dolichyl-phosphate-mannose-protein mannosyltransferase
MGDQELTSAPKTLRSEILLILAFFFSVFALTSSGFDTSEGSYDYAVAHQIWTRGTLSFASPAEETYPGTGITTIGPNGRIYASHEFGNTLLFLPVAGVNVALEKALGNTLGSGKLKFVTGFIVMVMPVIYCSITVALLYALLRICFEQSITRAITCSMAFAFCTFVWAYSRILSDVVLCMCLLTGAMFSMFQFRRTMKTSYCLVATALCGFGIIARSTMVLLLAAVLVYLTMVLWKDRKLLIRLLLTGIVILVPFAAWQTYYNQLRTGNWLIAPVMSSQYAAQSSLTGNQTVAISGLLFSPGKSIFLYVPLALLSVVCFGRFMAKYPCEATFVAALSGMWLFIHSKLATDWYGAWGWGPRHFVTIAPALVLPACACWEWMKESVWRRILLWLALTWGAILSISSIIGNWHFRMALADSQGRHDYDSMLWSPTRGQALDMIAGAVSNLRNMALHRPGPCLPSFSQINCYASNTINVWLNTAAYAGIPRPLLAATAIVIAAVATSSWIALQKIMHLSSDAEIR